MLPERGEASRKSINTALRLSEEFPWAAVEDFVIGRMERAGAKTVADIGGGRCPRIPVDVARRMNLDYYVLDISAQELQIAPEGYNKIQVDMAAPGIARAIDTKFDFAFSVFFLEHIRDPLTLHRNIWSLLAPDGIALHIFPTLYALPFVINAITPDWLSGSLLGMVQPQRKKASSGTAKFPAYYRWCCGPTKPMIARFESVGFQVEEYVGYFGHNYYRRIPYGDQLERMLSVAKLKMQLSYLTALAYCVLRKPKASSLTDSTL